MCGAQHAKAALVLCIIEQITRAMPAVVAHIDRSVPLGR